MTLKRSLKVPFETDTKLVPFESLGAVSYSPSIVTICFNRL